jgi:hypothetical protein
LKEKYYNHPDGNAPNPNDDNSRRQKVFYCKCKKEKGEAKADLYARSLQAFSFLGNICCLYVTSNKIGQLDGSTKLGRVKQQDPRVG